MRRLTRGVTLIELLIVITIIVLIAAIAIPTMGPVLKRRRIREAARSVNVYIGGARIRAMEGQRPVGVMFERDSSRPDASIVLRQVEVPEPYSGDVEGALLVLYPIAFEQSGLEAPPEEHLFWYWFSDTAVPVELGQPPFVPPPPAGHTNPPHFRPPPSDPMGNAFPPGATSIADFWYRLVESGDLIQLNYQGSVYRIHFPDPADLPGPDLPGPNTAAWYDKQIIRLSCHERGRPPTPGLVRGLPFQVFRKPQPTSTQPLQLTRGACVDLGDSGTDAYDPDPAESQIRWFRTGPNPMIMFAPNGSVERVHTGGDQHRVTRPIYLMIGRTDRTRKTSSKTGRTSRTSGWRSTRRPGWPPSPKTSAGTRTRRPGS
jgi:prepilin-type N-terminal cleavage/methylation domain-containing protein